MGFAERFNFFVIFLTSEIFKIFHTKRKLIRYYYFIDIYIAYQNRTFVMMKFVFFNFSAIKFYIFVSIFRYGFNLFYIFII